MDQSATKASGSYNRLGRTFILGCLAGSLWLGWLLFKGFLTAIATAAILDVVFYPLFARLVRRFGARRAAAAGATVLVVVLCVIVPMVLLGALFTQQALELYNKLSVQAKEGTGLGQVLSLRDWATVEGLAKKHVPWVDVQAINLKDHFLALLQQVSTRAVGIGTKFLSNVLSSVATFAVVLFSLFFFLLDGGRFGHWLSGLVPLAPGHQQRLRDIFIAHIKSAVLGSGAVALGQGLLGGLGFGLVGLPGVLWGTVMIFMSLVPVVGTALVWAPGALVLFLQGHTGAGLFLVAWGAFVVGGADNVIRIMVSRQAGETHPLLIFFSVMGGLQFAGILGVVFGPLILALVRTFLDIYREEFAPEMAAPAAKELTQER
jgi:predicted PurR-regulated permease PerM